VTLLGKRGSIRVEVVYALRDEQFMIELELEEGATVREAVERSGILQRYPAMNLEGTPLGIFGRIAGLETRLRDGDRVEIYRALLADPKAARRSRTKSGKRKRGCQ